MRRRVFIKICLEFLLISIVVLFAGCDELKVLLRKIKGRILPKQKVAPVEKRSIILPPSGGDQISVEEALNSRTTSDADGYPTIKHWGQYDSTHRLDDDTLNGIKKTLDKIPQLNTNPSIVTIKHNKLAFQSKAGLTGKDYIYAMIQSGFQQQATGLICATLGVGYCFMGLGKNGRQTDKSTLMTVKMNLEPMLPSYGNTYWTSAFPEKEKDWRQGNLPNPKRDGNSAFMDVIKRLTIEHLEGRSVSSKADIGQLLWAARGRTPHFYLSKPWGMTIPVSHGDQKRTFITLVTQNNYYRYVNWERGRPTHSLQKITGGDQYRNLIQKNSPYNALILFFQNENAARALWEIGYQVFNMMVQALSLNIAYRVVDCDLFKDMGPQKKEQGVPVFAIGLIAEKEVNL